MRKLTPTNTVRTGMILDNSVVTAWLSKGDFTLATAQAISHSIAHNSGWDDTEREMGTELMLIVSELGEAMEGDRKGLMDDHLPHRKMLEVELADAVIRILHLAGKCGMDMETTIREKCLYNMERHDHKREVRAAEGGKKY